MTKLATGHRKPFLGRCQLRLVKADAHELKDVLAGKDLHAGKDWRQRERSTAEDEMVG